MTPIREITVETGRTQMIDITSQVRRIIADRGIREGISRRGTTTSMRKGTPTPI